MRQVLTILLLCCCGWLTAQNFPYRVSVQTVSGQCYDDGHLIFTLLDNSGHEILIDPQTHNAVNTAQYPLYNVQYHYQNVSSGLGVQYDYNNDIMLSAGNYCVGVRASVPSQDGGLVQVDTTFCNVQVTTSYNHLEASAIYELASGTWEGDQERYGYRPSFHCADMGRIQLQITQGIFPYEVTILDEQQDTVRHVVFYNRVNSGNSYSFANYRDYYTFDNLPIGTYSIKVSDACGYVAPIITFTIPDAQPTRYLLLVHTDNNYNPCPDENVVRFEIERTCASGYRDSWYNYMYPYFDSTFRYRFINPGNDTTEWRKIISPPSHSSSGSWSTIFDTLPSYCVIFNDTIKVQLYDLCHDTLMTFASRYLPQFNLFDTSVAFHFSEGSVQDTCAIHLQSGVSTQSYMIGGDTWEKGGVITGAGWFSYVAPIPFRYYRCPISYNIWSLPDSTLLGHDESDDFTGIGTWVTFYTDTSVPVHISVTDAQGCLLVEKDTVFVYQTTPVDDLYFWYECHNDKDDDGKDHCCDARYLWIQEHGVEADTFRRNMTLRLIESPLYNQFNFTAIRQDGEWTFTSDNPDNHSTYLEFSYEDGWRATVRDSVCLAPGRYKFEVSSDCGVDTVTYEWIGYYRDSIAFTSAPQYESRQVCDRIIFTQVSTGLENYVYYIDPSVSNDELIQMECNHSDYTYSPVGISSTLDAQRRRVMVFSVPGVYPITTYAYNNPFSYNSYQSVIGWCTPYSYYYDSITVVFSYLDFDMVSAVLCDSLAETGIVSVRAINGTPPYTYTLYDQWGAAGNVVATSTSGFFDNVPMTEGQHLSVLVTDSCSSSFSVNITAALLTHGSLLWEQGGNMGAPYCEGDTLHLTALAFAPPATYQWTGPNGFSSTSQTNDIVVSSDGGSGWYTMKVLNSFCGPMISDSIYVMVLPTDIYDTICRGEGYDDNGFTLTAVETNTVGTITRSRTFTSHSGECTTTLHLTVFPAGVGFEEVTANESYTWNGVTYNTSGTYVYRFPSLGDCDSVVTLHLTITRIPEISITQDDDTLCVGDSTVLHAVIENADVFATLQAPPVAPGDILCTDGTTMKPSDFATSGKTAMGVVFFVDSADEQGWAMALHDVGNYVWSSDQSIDVPTLDNIVNSRDAIGNFDGYGNTQKLRAAGSATLFPAAWAVDFDNGWYLPAIGQLIQLRAQIATVNVSLELVGGTPFDLDEHYFYWSSTESIDGSAWNLTYGGSVRNDYKNLHYKVRSARNF